MRRGSEHNNATEAKLGWAVRISTCVLLFALGVSTACTMYGKKQHGWSGATGGEDLERQFWADVKSKNFPELEKHMAVTWVYVSSAGSLDRAATLDRFRQTPLTDYSLGDFKVRPNGRDMVVTYTATISATKHATPASQEAATATPPGATPIRMMTVWQRTEKGWIAIAHAEAI